MSANSSEALAVGTQLRRWRGERNMSQMSLAHEAEVSTRHISFIETGRSHPSREMVLLLSSALEVPLRERNALLASAGYAPVYRETELDAPEMSHVRKTLELILAQSEPFGAVVLDGRWNLLMSNEAASRMTATLCEDPLATIVDGQPNLLRLLFHPKGLRDSIVNYDEVARATLGRAHREAQIERDGALLQTIHEILDYPGVPKDYRRFDVSAAPPILIPIHFRKGPLDAKVFSTVTTLGTAQDITLRELRIEAFYPADPESDAAIRALSA